MPVIDMHAHVTPERYKSAIAETGSWYGLDSTVGELGLGGFSDSVETRLAGMDANGIDMQLLSANAGFYQYFNDLETTKAIARECNEEIAEMSSSGQTGSWVSQTYPCKTSPRPLPRWSMRSPNSASRE